MKRNKIISLAGSAAVVAGICVCMANNGGGTGAAPDKGAEIAGAIMILAPLAAGLIVLLVTGARAHRQWISQFTPAEQRAIRWGEGIAALAAVDIGLRELNRRSHESIARQAEASDRMRELTRRSAERAAAPETMTFGDPTAASREMLDRSRATREQHLRDRQAGWR